MDVRAATCARCAPRRQDGNTALIMASHKGHAAIVGTLVERGADISIENAVRLACLGCNALRSVLHGAAAHAVHHVCLSDFVWLYPSKLYGCDLHAHIYAVFLPAAAVVTITKMRRLLSVYALTIF